MEISKEKVLDIINEIEKEAMDESKPSKCTSMDKLHYLFGVMDTCENIKNELSRNSK